jgi:hypothetical protein
MNPLRSAENPAQAAEALGGVRFFAAECVYRPLPARAHSPAAHVLVWALGRRLRALGPGDGVLWVAADAASVESVRPWAAAAPHLRHVALIANPAPWPDAPGDTPARAGWPNPARWQRMATTDRWARVQAALRVGDLLAHGAADGPGALLVPALDAAYAPALLARLAAEPGVCSPVSPWAHRRVPGVLYRHGVPAAMNRIFHRAVWPFAQRQDADQPSADGQGVWGKCVRIPWAWCGPLLSEALTCVWEDDRELDAVLGRLGAPARALAAHDPAVYAVYPAVFTHRDLDRTIARYLHYTLDIPAHPPGTASLLALHAPPVRAALHALAVRVAAFGCSWADWGAYRIVARPGDPCAEVWRAGEAR